MSRINSQYRNISAFFFGGFGSSLIFYLKNKQDTAKDNLITKQMHEQVQKQLTDVGEKLDLIHKVKLEEANKSTIYSKINDKFTDLHSELETSKALLDKENSKTVLDSVNPDTFVSPSELLKSKLQNASDILNSIEKLMSELDSKNQKFNLDLSAFNSFVDSLNFTELLSYFHISGCILIIFCLISIVLTLFGNEALNYLKLESKFPSLSKLIKLRLTLTRYYILQNLIIILLACIFIIYIDFLVLTNV